MTIDYGTGVKEEVNGTLDEVIKVANAGIAYTQESVKILDNEKLVAKTQWIGIKSTPDDDVLCDFNEYDYYRKWEVYDNEKNRENNKAEISKVTKGRKKRLEQEYER